MLLLNQAVQEYLRNPKNHGWLNGPNLTTSGTCSMPSLSLSDFLDLHLNVMY